MESRIQEHPILGTYEKGRPVKFTYDGKEVEGYEGEPIAEALKANGVMIHRYTAKKHTPRGMFCAIGRCTDCVMVVDGEPNVRTCMTPLKEGMVVQTQYGNSAKPFEEQEVQK
ncbi:MAG: (2Fe-2S)-binding protein [Acutalibacteraceae bacterium]|nr:(2Fe-2S)-binding protein [Acutalibacteraceae bacterium]